MPSSGPMRGHRLPRTRSTSWSFARARQAAARVRAAPLGRRAADTIRPRSVIGLVRSRAPLALLLYVAARDGLVAEQDGGGFAVLRRPANSKPIRSGGRWLRLLRWLDRCWDFALFTVPPSLGLLTAALTAPFAASRAVAILTAFAAILWVSVFLTLMMAFQLQSVARMGRPSGPGWERAAESLPAYHWSVPLVHQPDLYRIDELMRILIEQMVSLIHADLQASGGDKVRVGCPDVTETLVVLTNGVTTSRARAAMAQSLRVIRGYPPHADVIVLEPPGRLERLAPHSVTGGGFLLLYVTGLAATIAVCATLVADMEARACLPATCAGRPATCSLALRWLMQRLVFADPSGLSPVTAWAALLGWLVSAASAMLLVVVLVAARREIAAGKQTSAVHMEAISGLIDTARVLILVVTPCERDAVLRSVREHVGRHAVLDHSGERTIYTLGSVAGNQLMLAQAGEQGSASAAAMLGTATDAIRQCRPDYVVLTGVCFGLRPDQGQQIGDIIVARRVQDLDHVKETGDIDRPTIYRGVHVGCSPELLDRFQASQSAWPGARVHIGTVLTSNKLVDSRQVVTRLRRDFPDAIAGEMEGTAVHEAAMRDIKPDWIMVKGISDWGYGKTSNSQPLAAQNAAEFVTYVIASGVLRRRRNG